MSSNFKALRFVLALAGRLPPRSQAVRWGRTIVAHPRSHRTPVTRPRSTGRPRTSPRLRLAAAAWWKSLNDPELNQLIETALVNSPDIRAAQARLRQSRAGLREQQRNELPKSSGSAAYLHAHLPSSSLSFGAADLYDVGFDATWEVDLFGGTRRAIEAAIRRGLRGGRRSRRHTRATFGGNRAGVCRSARPTAAYRAGTRVGGARGADPHPDPTAPRARCCIRPRRRADPHPGREHARNPHSARRADHRVPRPTRHAHRP